MAFSLLKAPHGSCQHHAARHRRCPVLVHAAQQQPPTTLLQQQRPWQQAVLEAMQQHSQVITDETISSCVTLDAQLDRVYDALDEIFYSKVGWVACVLARARVSCVMHCCLRAHCMALQGGFVIPKRERARIDATGGSSSYGEVQAAGVDQLLK